MGNANSFRTFQETISILNSEYELNIDSECYYRSQDNYEVISYPNSFLGSYGILTGDIYTEKDHIQIYQPIFNTHFIHKYYEKDIEKWSKKGEFHQVFIDDEILQNTNYLNKYNAYMFNSACESHVINIMNENNLRCLIISDSFSRPLVPYYSLCFSELAWIDPQQGRYDKNCKEFIDNFQPDCIIVLFNGN